MNTKQYFYRSNGCRGGAVFTYQYSGDYCATKALSTLVAKLEETYGTGGVTISHFNLL